MHFGTISSAIRSCMLLMEAGLARSNDTHIARFASCSQSNLGARFVKLVPKNSGHMTGLARSNSCSWPEQEPGWDVNLRCGAATRVSREADSRLSPKPRQPPGRRSGGR
jgi:hypothetical protein